MTLSQRLRPLRLRLALLFMILGPGIITANVDNDAGGITTYSVAGARYGYGLLWMLPLVVLALIIVQEMSARLGVVTGKGLADLIRERLGVRVTAVLLGVAGHRQPGQHGQRVRRGGCQHGDLWHHQVHLRPAGRRRRLADHRQGQLQERRAGLPGRQPDLPDVCRLGHPRPAGLGRGPAGGRHAELPVRRRLRYPVRHRHRDDDRPVDAVLPAGVDRGQGAQARGPAYERLDVLVGSLFAVLVAGFIVIACAATIFSPAG